MNQDIVNQKRITIFQKWATLDEKEKTLYGTKVAQMLNSLRTTHYTVTKNFEELSLSLNSYESNTTLWDPAEREKRILFFMEFSRLFHNYLSSTYTLIAQGKKLSIRYEKISDFYKTEIVSLQSDDSYNFSICLRHITQHYELLDLVAHFSRRGIEIGQPLRRSIVLGKPNLIDRKDELRPSVERDGFVRYIDKHDEIDLKLLLNQYQSLLNNFFEKFNLKARELYAKELKEYEAIENEIQQLQLDLRNTK